MGLHVDAERLILTTSTSEGYSFVFRLLCNPGDELLVPKPSYPLFEFLADLQDVRLVPYPLIYDHGWQMDFPSLQNAVTQAHAWRDRGPSQQSNWFVRACARADSLNSFCREHELALIADEVFLDYAHNGAPQPSFAANQDVLTFTSAAFPKFRRCRR